LSDSNDLPRLFQRNRRLLAIARRRPRKRHGRELESGNNGLKSKGEKPEALFEAVERLLFEYAYLVRHGQTRHDGRKVEWFTYDSPSKRGHILISFSDRDEWCDDCYSDEVPLWLLIAILRKLRRIKPLGDQKANETIAAVHEIDNAYSVAKRFEDGGLFGVNTVRREQ